MFARNNFLGALVSVLSGGASGGMLFLEQQKVTVTRVGLPVLPALLQPGSPCRVLPEGSFLFNSSVTAGGLLWHRKL